MNRRNACKQVPGLLLFETLECLRQLLGVEVDNILTESVGLNSTITLLQRSFRTSSLVMNNIYHRTSPVSNRPYADPSILI